MEQLPSSRQSLFFTATWPQQVQGLAADFLRSPIQINIGVGGQLNANKSIVQKVMVVKEFEKNEELLNLLEDLRGGADRPPSAVSKTLIFVSRKSSCDELANELHQLGYAVETLHGDKSQERRTRAMDQFRAGRVKVLIATDVASRGIDVKDIVNVINFDFPEGGDVESYVHRIGRTGRAGATGNAFTFFTKLNAPCAHELVGVMERCDQEVPEELLKMAASRKGPPERRNFQQRRSNGGFGGGGDSKYGFAKRGGPGGGSSGFGNDRRGRDSGFNSRFNNSDNSSRSSSSFDPMNSRSSGGRGGGRSRREEFDGDDFY